MPAFRALRAGFDALSATLERFRWVLIVLLACWFGWMLASKAEAKTFWHDEVYTILTAQLPVAKLWQSGPDGADLSPPLNTFVTRAVQLVAGEGRVTSRIPPMAGFIVAAVLLFLTVRRRTNAIVGVAATLFLGSTPAWDYSTEARGYGLSLAWCALAFSAWSEAAEGRRVRFHWIVMGAAIAAGLWTHYYSVLVCVPIAAGEAVRQWARRSFQVAPWAAMTAGVAAVAPLWGHIATASANRTNFWAKPNPDAIYEVYPFVVKDMPDRTFVIAGLALLVVVEMVRRWQTGTSARRLAAHDWAAILGCLALPAIGFALGYSTNAFTTRYLVFATVAFAFAVPVLLWRLTPDTGIGDVVLAVALSIPFVMFSRGLVVDPPTWTNPVNERSWLLEWLRAPEPVMMTGGVDFLGVWYNLPDSVKPRAVYLADPESELALTGADTVDVNYLALSRWTSVPVVRSEEFLKSHPTFWLYAFGHSWPERRLRDIGVTMTEVVKETNGSATLYKVTVKSE